MSMYNNVLHIKLDAARVQEVFVAHILFGMILL